MRTERGEAAAPFLLDSRLWMAAWAIILGATSVLYLLPNAGPPGEAQLDKIVHIGVFGAIGLASRLSTGSAKPGAATFASLVLAVALEWLQGFVPGREYSVLDCVANLVGIGAGLAAAGIVHARAARQSDPSA